MLKTIIKMELTAAACSQVWAASMDIGKRAHVEVAAGDLVTALESLGMNLTRVVRLTADATNLLNQSSLSYVGGDRSLPSSGSAPGRNYHLSIQASF